MQQKDYRFGAYCFEMELKLLVRDGIPVPLGRRAADLLAALLAADGGVVSKSALLDAAWPDQLVEESNLPVQIAALRKLLGKTPDGGEWITTVERVGYRFLPNAVAAGGRPEAPAAQASALPTIAVHSFAVINPGPEQQMLSDGLAEDFRTELSRFRSLRVLSRHHASAAAAGNGATADYILDGSIRRAGSQIRISAQLIRGTDSHQLWAEKFDVDQEQLFSVQEQLLERIVTTLAARLSAAETAAAHRKPPGSLAAYECVLRADAISHNDPARHGEARNLLKQAIVLDPGYARAYAVLAVNLELEWEFDVAAPDGLLDEALALARKAVFLDSAECLGHSALCVVHLNRKEHEASERHGLIGLKLNSNRAAQLGSLGYLYNYIGDLEKSRAYFVRAREIDPFFEPSWYWQGLAMMFFNARDYVRAAELFRRVHDPSYWTHALLAACETKLGHRDRAASERQQLLRLAPGFSVSKRVRREPFKREADAAHLSEALLAANLPP